MFYERLKLLASEKKKSLNQIEIDLGFSKNTLYNTKKYTPQGDKLTKLAEYFGVSTDYLLGNTTSQKLDLAKLDDDIVASNLSYSGKELTDNDRIALNAILKDYFEGQDDKDK